MLRVSFEKSISRSDHDPNDFWSRLEQGLAWWSLRGFCEVELTTPRKHDFPDVEVSNGHVRSTP